VTRNLQLQQPTNMSNTGRTVKTTFCLVSDTHGKGPKPPEEIQWAFREPLPSADVLLHAGDLTMIGELQHYKNVLDWIKSVDAELKIVIAGNHDIDLHEEYYLRYSGEEPEVAMRQVKDIKDLWTGPDAREAGVVYLDEGLNTFQLKSGAVFTVEHPSIAGTGLLILRRSILLRGNLNSATGLSTIPTIMTAGILPHPLPSLRLPIPYHRGQQ